MLKGALFDMDGLMFDTERVYRDNWILAAQKFQRPYDPAFHRAVCGTSGEHLLDVVRTHFPGVDPQAFRDYCFEQVDEILKKEVPIKKGLFEILDCFRSHGVKMAVASSSLPGIVRRNLRIAGVDHYFDAVVSGTQIEHGKPAPDIYLLAAEKIGVDPGECYVFEDNLNGIRAGVAAGCRSYMIPDLMEPTDEARAICSGIFEDLGAAMRALEAE